MQPTAEQQKAIEGHLRLIDQEITHVAETTKQRSSAETPVQAGRALERVLKNAYELRAAAAGLRTELAGLHLCEPPAESNGE